MRRFRQPKRQTTPMPGTCKPMRWGGTARASAWQRLWHRAWAPASRTHWKKPSQLQPLHADAHITLGAFHAEVIDKVGSLIGGMTYGAKKDTGLKLFQQALKLSPGSAIAMVEYANGQVMLEGERRMKEATALYEKAAACTPMDAMERLDVEMARAELED